MPTEQTNTDDFMHRLKELENAQQASQHVCPNCGYCPHCGRGGYGYGYPWYPPNSPYYPGITWICSGSEQPAGSPMWN